MSLCLDFKYIQFYFSIPQREEFWILMGSVTVEQWSEVLRWRSTHSHVVAIDGTVDLPHWVFHVVLVSIIIDFLGFLYCLQKSHFLNELQISLIPNPRLSPCVLNLQGKKLCLVNRYDNSKARRVCGLVAFRGSECS